MNNMFVCSECNNLRSNLIMLSNRPGVCEYCKYAPARRGISIGENTVVTGGKVFNVTYTRVKMTKEERKASKGQPILQNRQDRTPWIADQDGVLPKYIPSKFFQNYEVSEHFSKLAKGYAWGDVVTEDPDHYKELVESGFEFQGEFYWCVFGKWSGQKGKLMFVHEDSQIRTLADMGIHTRMSVLSEAMKATKYLGRDFAPCMMGHRPIYGREQEGSWVEATQECVVELETGEELIVKFVDKTGLSDEAIAQKDGNIGMSAKAWRAFRLGNKPEVGDSYKVTIDTQRKFGKGHAIYQPNQVADIVIYMAKKHVFHDEFCFMVIGEVHAGNVRSDIQSVVNFKLYHLLLKLAQRLGHHFYAMFNRNEKTIELARQFLRHVDLDPEEYMNPGEEEDKFVLSRALALDVSPFAFPGLYRRIYRFILSIVYDFAKFRIPLNVPGFEVATAKYICGEPQAIDDDGTPNLDKCVIPEGYICVPDLPEGISVVLTRRPNENSNAFVKLINMHHENFPKGKDLAYIGRGCHKVLARLGGADNDDNVVIYYHPDWVAHFDTLSYPETEKLVAVESGSVVNPYDNQPEDVSDFGHMHILKQLSESSGFGNLGIGPAVNLNMIDMLVSDPDNKNHMLEDLERRAETQPLLMGFHGALEANPEFQSAFMATNLEIIIDAAVKDPALLNAMNDEAVKRGSENLTSFVRDWHARQRVYPVCMANRIPEAKQDMKDYVLAKSELCEVQDRLKRMHRFMNQKLILNEYKLFKPVDPIIATILPESSESLMRLMYGTTKVGPDGRRVEDRRGIKGWWKSKWVEYQQAMQDDGKEIYSFITKELESLLEQYNPDQMEALTLELYRGTYRTIPVPKKGGNGEYPAYWDGLLWTNRFANTFLNLLDQAGLTGMVAPVGFVANRHLIDAPEVQVLIKGNQVFTLVGNELIGNIALRNPMGKLDGVKTMKMGMIRVKEANMVLQPKVSFFADAEPLNTPL